MVDPIASTRGRSLSSPLTNRSRVGGKVTGNFFLPPLLSSASRFLRTPRRKLRPRRSALGHENERTEQSGRVLFVRRQTLLRAGRVGRKHPCRILATFETIGLSFFFGTSRISGKIKSSPRNEYTYTTKRMFIDYSAYSGYSLAFPSELRCRFELFRLKNDLRVIVYYFTFDKERFILELRRAKISSLAYFIPHAGRSREICRKRTATRDIIHCEKDRR